MILLEGVIDRAPLRLASPRSSTPTTIPFAT
jgi:hypothetical protein